MNQRDERDGEGLVDFRLRASNEDLPTPYTLL
jgi:hypothetical protein